MQEEIEFVINPDGTIEATVNGIKGPVCEGLLDDWLQELDETIEQRRTREYYQQGRVRKNTRTQIGGRGRTKDLY